MDDTLFTTMETSGWINEFISMSCINRQCKNWSNQIPHPTPITLYRKQRNNIKTVAPSLVVVVTKQGSN